MDADVAQLERNNNKCYALTFRYIYIYIDNNSSNNNIDVVYYILK